jgi:hypothetical protein
MQSVNLAETNLVSSWPGLVGVSSQQAQQTIAKERPDLNIFIVPEGSIVTTDYRLDRVRVIVDNAGKVVDPPTTG